MYKNFILTESEREQILNMHKNNGYGKKLREGDDEKYFARHGEGNIPWTGSSNKTYGDLPDGDYDDETYDDFDTLHATHPEFHSHYSGKGNVDRAKHMFDTYKRSQGPLLVKKRRIQTEQQVAPPTSTKQSLSKPSDVDVKGAIKTVNQNKQIDDKRKKYAYDIAIKAKDIKMGDFVSVSNDISLGYYDSWAGSVIKIDPDNGYGLGFTLLGANNQTYFFTESMVQKIENTEPKNWRIVVFSFKSQDLRTK